MQVRGKSNLVAVLGIIVFSLVLALLGAMLLTQPWRKPVALKSSVQVREDDIRNLERLLKEDVDIAHSEGKSDAQIEEIRAKYNLEIDRLKAEIEKIKSGGQLDVP